MHSLQTVIFAGLLILNQLSKLASLKNPHASLFSRKVKILFAALHLTILVRCSQKAIRFFLILGAIFSAFYTALDLFSDNIPTHLLLLFLVPVFFLNLLSLFLISKSFTSYYLYRTLIDFCTVLLNLALIIIIYIILFLQTLYEKTKLHGVKIARKPNQKYNMGLFISPHSVGVLI